MNHLFLFCLCLQQALQIPLDVGCYSAGASEPLSTTLRRLSKHHQADWTEAEAQAQGPYADQTSGELLIGMYHSCSVCSCLFVDDM